MAFWGGEIFYFKKMPLCKSEYLTSPGLPPPPQKKNCKNGLKLQFLDNGFFVTRLRLKTSLTKELIHVDNVLRSLRIAPGDHWLVTTIMPGALLSDCEQGWRRGATCHCHDAGHEAVTERLGTGPRTMSGTQGRRALTIRHRRAFRSISENYMLNAIIIVSIMW